MNWCTMICRQCRFMSSACVLSAASRICNGRFLEVLPHLPGPAGAGTPVDTEWATCSTFCTVTFISRFCLQ